MASRRKARILAFQALFSWEASQASVAELVDFPWLEEDKRTSIDEGTAAFAQFLIAGTIENIEQIDTLIKKHLKNWNFDRLNRVDLAIMRMSVYSLLFQKEIPPSIVIDEAIDIAKEFGTDDSYRFINGVLDAVKKEIQGSSLSK
ncbi:MAG: transcription antitermination factor NusB [Termitinemataceae bacterium]